MKPFITGPARIFVNGVDMGTINEQPKICPYCGHNAWHNSWGAGNASCAKCQKEFNLTFVNGLPTGTPVEDKHHRNGSGDFR